MPPCGAETHLFFSHETIDASDTSASRIWSPCRPASPKDSIRSELRGPQRARRVLGNTMAGRSREVFVTKRHKTPRFGRFCPEGEFRCFGLICAKPRKRINFRASAQIFSGHFERKNRGYAPHSPGFCAARAAIERHTISHTPRHSNFISAQWWI